METITANLYDSRQITVDRARDLKESAEMHRDIYRAIRSRNPAQARLTMERHLNLARVAQDAESDPTSDHGDRSLSGTAIPKAATPATPPSPELKLQGAKLFSNHLG